MGGGRHSTALCVHHHVLQWRYLLRVLVSCHIGHFSFDLIWTNHLLTRVSCLLVSLWQNCSRNLLLLWGTKYLLAVSLTSPCLFFVFCFRCMATCWVGLHFFLVVVSFSKDGYKQSSELFTVWKILHNFFTDPSAALMVFAMLFLH